MTSCEGCGIEFSEEELHIFNFEDVLQSGEVIKIKYTVCDRCLEKALECHCIYE